MLFATPKFFLNAISATHKLGWKPQVYIASVSIEPTIMAIARLNAPELTKGALSIAFLKNPNDPVWAKDPAVALYRSIMQQVQPDREADRRLQLVRHDRRVDDGRDAAQGREEPHARRAPRGRAEPRHDANPFMLPGHPPADVARRTTARSNDVYLYRYDNKQWVKASGLLRVTRRAESASAASSSCKESGARHRGVYHPPVQSERACPKSRAPGNACSGIQGGSPDEKRIRIAAIGVAAAVAALTFVAAAMAAYTSAEAPGHVRPAPTTVINAAAAVAERRPDGVRRRIFAADRNHAHDEPGARHRARAGEG